MGRRRQRQRKLRAETHVCDISSMLLFFLFVPLEPGVPDQ
jgi:hypothetical protein